MRSNYSREQLSREVITSISNSSAMRSSVTANEQEETDGFRI